MSQLDAARLDDVGSTITVERRAWVRYPSSQATLCQEKTAQTYDLWFMARISDISENGVRLVLGHAFQLGDVVAVEPIRTQPPLARALQARVIYSNEEKRGVWMIGCEFCTALSGEELESFTQTASGSITHTS